MKTRWGLSLAALLVAAVVQAATNTAILTEDQLGELYIKAFTRLSVGQYDAADEAARQLRTQLPNEPKVIQLQRQIELARKGGARAQADHQLEQQLAQIIVPKVDFRQADPAAVIDWLRAESAKLTADKAPVNLVWMVPVGTKLPPVTLNLENIPLLDLLRYTTQAARLKLRVEQHAAVISLPPPAAAPKPDVQPQSE